MASCILRTLISTDLCFVNYMPIDWNMKTMSPLGGWWPECTKYVIIVKTLQILLIDHFSFLVPFRFCKKIFFEKC